MKKKPQKIYDEFGNISLKVVLLQESGIGKSSIISRLLDGIFEDNIQNTLSVRYIIKIMEFTILVYDITNKNLLKKLQIIGYHK